MTNFKTYQNLIKDAQLRIESNPTDTEYVNTQLTKIIQWQTEMLELQSKPNFKISDKVYIFNNKQEFKELINNERRIARRLYKETKIEGYHNYELYAHTVIEVYSEATDEQIQDIRIDNLKEFIVFEQAKKSARFSTGCDIMSGRHGWIQPQEGRYNEEMLYHMDQIKEAFKHGQTSLQEN